ncbi:MAG: hypothetical protein WBC53_02330 [Phycisphaerae bacterium]
MGYVTPETERQQIKDCVLKSIAPSEKRVKCGRALYRVGGVVVHVRYRAPGSRHYGFNINPNTLRAEYALWICGSPGHWYLIPIEVVRRMYEHPRAYPDKHHTEIRVVTVETGIHRVGYAAPSVHLDFSSYFRATLDSSQPTAGVGA